jgi:hypothetical protein
MPVHIDEQIKAAEREVQMRTSVYPRRVAGGQMSQKKADEEIARMQAVVATLRHARSVLAAVRASHGTIRQAEGGNIVPTAVLVDAEPLWELQEAAKGEEAEQMGLAV